MKGCDINFVEKLKLSVVIITLNEELNIERCLKSIQWADEVLVYDSGSKDKTLEIAKHLGARIIEGPWLGFGPTKNKAALLARNDWILSLDADEEVSTALAAELSQLSLKSESVYVIPRLSNYLNHWVRYGGWYPDYQVRLFQRNFHNWNQELIHEKIEANVEVRLLSCLNHYVFKNIEHHIETNNRYSGLLAQKMFSNGQRFSWFHFLTKPQVKFFECYILKLGFLDGWVGYFIARGAAYSVFLKWAKLKEMNLKK